MRVQKTYSKQVRRPMAHVSSFIVNHLYQRNKWATVWWSAAFPGFGHLMICKYFTGALLIAWEFFINIQAHVNLAIYYSMIGKFEMAKHVIDTRWFLLYCAVYMFAMWDCYRLTIDLNKFALLADREDPTILPFKISALEINYLDNRNSWTGVIWSCFNPGLGALYIGRLPTGFYLMIWFVAVVYYAHILPAIHATFIGHFQIAKETLDPEWLLFLPSIMGFATYDAYLQNQALNQLFKVEQSRFLSDHYQKPTFTTRFGDRP